ncbi:MAG TPA: EAL domain-containing protein [Rhizomicrobium sp.]|nr:EAL domain-containing protein [Rhizomicrobium sp.]
MVNPARLLGFAFANADLLFEVDENGTIVFATGAASEFTHNPALVGENAGRLFEPEAGRKFAAYMKGLGRGGRAGPLKLKLAGGSDAVLSLCQLPLNGGNVSCTLSKPGAKTSFGNDGKDAKTGLPDNESFLATAGKVAAGMDALSLVEVPGLTDAVAKLSRADSESLLGRIGQTIQNAGMKAAGRISADAFGAIAGIGSRNKLAQVIREALAEGGLNSLQVEETLVSLKAQGLTGDQRMLALRYVTDRLSKRRPGEKLPADLGAAFEGMVRETEARALKLTETVADGSFELAFQPIVKLATREVSHYEALARFSQNQNTGETIRFVEALGIADAFDAAAAIKVMSVIEREGVHGASIALNISGHTLSTPSSFALVAGFLSRKRVLAKRVLVEVTETAEIADLDAANKAIQGLRELGYRVGLDDFGAGAASFQYLHAFAVDFVKIDGSLIGSIGKSARDDALLKSILKLCGELKIETIAEFVADKPTFERVREMGFDFGQGVFLGAPMSDLPPPPATAAAVGRRMGMRESWG